MTERKTMRVVAAYIERDGRVLLDRRRKGSHLADHWEFPGGKCEPGETDQQALVRELREELGVDATVDPSIIAEVRHPYETFDIELILYAARFDGDAKAVDVAAIEWFDKAALANLPMPPADVPLLEAIMALPVSNS